MTKYTSWQDDYWLLLMQVYLKRPVGVKPTYSRELVELSLELHISPQRLHERMEQMAQLKTRRIEHLMATYSGHPNKLARAARLLREMKGYGNAAEFFDGVETNETFERDFRPLEEDERLTPVALILVLDLYFRLTPITMVTDTPEVQQLARLIKIKASEVVDVMEVLQHCDPYLKRKDVTFSPLLLPCQQIWRRFGNANTEDLASYAEQLKEYFK